MDILLQQLINGLTLGAVYALIALGYTMVYGIIELINFAHGEIYMIGAYVGIIVLTLLTVIGFAPAHLALAIFLALLAAMLVCAAYGYTLERVAYRPLRSAPRLSPLISAVGMSIFLQNYVMLTQGSADKVLPLALPTEGIALMGAQVSPMQGFILLTSVALMAALTLFIRKTRLGKAMRATAQDRTMAALVGIPVDRIIATTFVVGSILAAVAGVMVALYYGSINFFIGYSAGLKAFTAAVLGGIGNIPGAMVGGVLLGLLESLGASYVSSEYKDAFAFGILILLLIFRPQGLLGERVPEKV
ncbi:MAG: branched-chain amino acid ABC transporter permease [Nitrospirae bacterium]|nr:branched-chain amino acid ABC transporter permease [Nitrospirota bacterium]